MNFTISYAITACNEHKELKKCISHIIDHKRGVDEIIVQVDSENHTKAVSKVINSFGLVKHKFPLNNNFSNFKNNLKKICNGDYIFQIDADEIPAEETISNLHNLIESNLDIDLFLVPRINILNDSTESNTEKMGWSLNNEGCVNWPDYQYRIFKNNFNIKWDGSLGHKISGAQVGSQLPDSPEYAITKTSTSEKVFKELSQKLSLCLCVANSEDCLPRFFDWAIPRFSNIVILESKSEDSTSEILNTYKQKYPKQINLHFKDIKNIADQKQHCLNLCKTEWKLIVDADEILENHDWISRIQHCETNNIDLCFLPRYNLQKDDRHYLTTAYPDLQPRLINSQTSFSTNPMHETHHVMVGHRNQSNISDCHIIHWGHIRSEEQNLWKSRMRKQFASTDLCDGEGLLSTENWFHERNRILKLNDSIEKLPQKALDCIYIKKQEKQNNLYEKI